MNQFGGMDEVVVETFEEGVFEREATLTMPVVLLEHRHHFGDGVGLFHRHDGETLLRNGVVEADGKVTLAFLKESLKGRNDTHAGNSDAVRTPRQTPIGGEHLGRSKDIVVVVHGFAHAHIDNVSDLRAFWDREKLVENFSCGEVAMETLLAGYAKTAPHLASFLTGDTKGGSVAIGDEDCLNGVKKVFFCAIGRDLAESGGVTSYGSNLIESRPSFEG